ncbi:FUSC family protein [Rhodoblastus sp.]|uniref:FUSC family protein n=1 Tax=Rhodoblastus sp. TaxID=1962975 RepID=UPI0035ADE308
MSQGDYSSRMAQALKQEFGALSFSGPTASLAFRTALSSVLAMIVAMALHLDNPYWAAITAVAIVQPDMSSTLGRSVDRCLGTIAGAAVGYFGAHFVADHLIFQLIVASAVAFGVYGMERSAHGYAVLLGSVTVILVMFGALEAPDAALRLAVYRSLEIMVGVGVAFLVELVVSPPSESAPFPDRPGIFAPPLDEGLLTIAITGGLATASIPVIWEALQLPGLGQTPITAFVILVAMRREPVLTALNRLAGCVMGGLYGLFCMHFVDDNILLWLVLLFAGLYVASHVKHGGGDAAYSGHQAGVAVILSMVEGLAPSPDILPAINRLVGIIGGMVVVVAAQALIAPLVGRVLAAALGRSGAAGQAEAET